MRVVFDDQQDRIAVGQITAIIFDPGFLFRGGNRGEKYRHRRRYATTFNFDNVRRSRPNVRMWQVKCELAALPGRALELDFAAEQAGQFAADRQAKPGSAKLAAGARICLLEGFKYYALLLLRNT